MNEDQAIAVFLPLLSAAESLDEARAAAALIADSDDRAAELEALTSKLNTQLMPAIFDHFYVFFPDSSARWDQIKLSPAVSETALDEIILSVVSPDWKKMAFLIWEMSSLASELDPEIDRETLVARVRILIESNRLEYRGDPLDWRSYEGRLEP
ncbi:MULTISPECIES: DUF3658 domain-containing protein [unclassified Bradyrhizobium]|uniref:DUF3658 domain-containing protein n=1 Tax=unclassified Bradyrhizobium TaxID=2631580 RepID=UPI001FF84760|nr:MULTISPECIES: DUF3658 domain-containing protein [unclassified Bradyrhizobium]MCK1709949.1 hypothetical protein [Bradyrhizobium sp. 143]MCK1729621.1 hypothetical protein [Bradyrhizobium sp. 142]